jgi:transcription antitermination factor NusG
MITTVTQAVVPQPKARPAFSCGGSPPAPRRVQSVTDSILPLTFGAVPVEKFTAPWLVAQIEGGKEKAFVSDLTAREIPFFAPWQIIKTRDAKWRNTRVRQAALFPGYSFITGEPSIIYDASRCRGWIGAIRVTNQAKLRKELAALYRVLLHDPVITKPLGIGSLAYIASGPFQGMSGPVIAHANGVQLVLQISMLGQSVAVEIDPAMVEAA